MGEKGERSGEKGGKTLTQAEEVKNALDIVDIIGERVRLTKTSRGFMGLCPFHDEKTPSFHVFSDTQTYYCFGCHEAGNIFTFVMKTEGLNFQEALGLLASRAGIKITQYEKRNNNSKSLYEIIDMAAKFFTANLTGPQGSVARAYMERRKMEENDIARFSLGYSLNSWDSLVNYLRKLGIKDKQLLDSGLALQGNRGLYDRFRGRLMFPVKDVAGKIIAFGGRLIDGEGAKYINSPEGEIYSKRKNLYLLHEARKYIREKDRAILVEGYMDALRLHKCGFHEAVASLGTSLTEEQAELLSRFSGRCYICYDSDTAGQSAALRGMYILQEHGLDVQVVNIPEGKDPDEFLSNGENTPEDFEKILEKSTPLVLQQIKSLTPAFNIPSLKKAAIKELFENLSKLELNEIAPYRMQISELTLIPPSELEERLSEAKKFLKKNANINTSEKNSFNSKSKNYDAVEAGLCAMLFDYSECRLSIEPEEVYKILQSDLARETAISLLTENPDMLTTLWLSTGETEKMGLIARGEVFCKSMKEENMQDKWQAIYKLLKAEWIKRRINEIHLNMQQNSATYSELQELTRLQDMREEYTI